MDHVSLILPSKTSIHNPFSLGIFQPAMFDETGGTIMKYLFIQLSDS